MNKTYASLLLLSVLAATGCSQQKVAAKEAPAVRAHKVEFLSVEQPMRYAATLEPAAQADIAFRASGVVESIASVRGIDGRSRPLDSGDRISAGSVLAVIRSTEYRARTQSAQSATADARAGLSAAQASAAEAEAGLKQAELDFTRGQNLFNAQAMTRAEFDSVRTRLDAAKARLNAARSQATMVEARIGTAEAALAETKVSLGDTTLTAPFSGVVVARRIERGVMAGPTAPAFTIADISRVKATFYVPDTALAKFPIGAETRISVDALPGQEFEGRIESVSPSADPATRSFRVQALVPNPKLVLKAGMVANVEGSQPITQRTLAVPLSSLVRTDAEGKQFAVLVIDNTTVRRRPITIGAPVGNMVAVAGGLAENDQIVREGLASLHDGDKVQVLP